MKLILAFIAITLASCAQLQEYAVLVNDRAPDGTYLPVSQVKNPNTGSSAVAKGSFYIFADGTVGVSGAAGPGGPVASPKFSIQK